MEREIKFRAWSKPSKKMISWDEILNDKYFKDYFGLKYMTNPPTPVCVLMQFTGLKDKNGREIYEGDVLKFKWGQAVGISPVIYNNGAFVLRLPSPNEKVVCLVSHGNETAEIIGNIYETPELIK